MNILKSMSFNDGKGLILVGSNSIRSQQYAADYDGYQVVQMSARSDEVAAREIVRQWQENVKRLRALSYVYIGDIKCGTVEQWRVIPSTARLVEGKVVDYNPAQSKRKLDELLAAKIISPAEAKEAHALLKSPDNVAAFLQAKQTIKFHVIRWTAREILLGRKKLRDRRWMYLREAVLLPGVAKMDAVALIQKSRFTDFSVIYEFRNKDKVLNPETYNIRDSLRESIVAYKTEGNYFKTLKRIYALAKYENDLDTIKELTPVLNSDLGRLYHIVSDIRTLVELLEQPRVPLPLIRYEIDQFIGRLSNIYTLTDYLKAEGEVIGRLHSIMKMSKSKMAEALSKLGDQLDGYLQYATKHILNKPLNGGLRGGITLWKAIKLSIKPIIAGLAVGGSVAGVLHSALAGAPAVFLTSLPPGLGGAIGVGAFLVYYITRLINAGVVPPEEGQAAIAQIQEEYPELEDPTAVDANIPSGSEPDAVIPVSMDPIPSGDPEDLVSDEKRKKRKKREEHVAIDVEPAGASAPSRKPKGPPKGIRTIRTGDLDDYAIEMASRIPSTRTARRTITAPGSAIPDTEHTAITVANPLHTGTGKKRGGRVRANKK